MLACKIMCILESMKYGLNKLRPSPLYQVKVCKIIERGKLLQNKLFIGFYRITCNHFPWHQWFIAIYSTLILNKWKKWSLFLLGRQILQREAVDTSLDCIYKGAYDHLFTLFQLIIYIENNCHEFSGWNVPVDSLSLFWLKKVWVTKNCVNASFIVKMCSSNMWLAQCYSF